MSTADDEPRPGDVTVLLGKLGKNEPLVREHLYRLVEKELRRRADAFMAQQKPLYNLQTTVLIDDAFRKLVDDPRISWDNREHFYCLAAKVMRQVMVDAARKEKAERRGGGLARASLEEVAEPMAQQPAASLDLLVLDEALTRLEADHPQWAKVVELRFYGGRTNEEVASILQVSVPTVKNYWKAARGFLHRELQ